MDEQDPSDAADLRPDETIEFDPEKDASNIEKHGLPLSFGASVLTDPFIMHLEDVRRDYGEVRWRSLGIVESRVYVVVHTKRGSIRRIISVRKANEREIKVYSYAKAKS